MVIGESAQRSREGPDPRTRVERRLELMSGPVRHVDDRERRSRLAVRHAVASAHRVADTVAATRAMTVLHATEAASVYLAVRARTEGVSPDDVDRALYSDRSVIKQLAMRRTLFVFPRDLLPAAWGSAAAHQAVRFHVADDQAPLLGRDPGEYTTVPVNSASSSRNCRADSGSDPARRASTALLCGLEPRRAVLGGADLGRHASAALDAEAERLTTWLDGVRITNAYASQLMKHQRLP